MKFFLFILFAAFISSSVLGQNEKYWYAFEVDDTITNRVTLSLGFKNSNGNVKIEPKYLSPLTPNKRFEKTVALTEYSAENLKGFYINKQGKKFGTDSLYTIDYLHDTEHEGFIRFSTGRFLDSIGVFNSNGKIVVNPIYNSLSKVSNGLLIAKIGAKQIHENKHAGCDHWIFKGGKNMIIDTLGTVLIDNFNDNNLVLNLYTVKVSKQKIKDDFRYSFIGKNKMYYSFISSRKEFENFIDSNFLKHFSPENLLNHLFVNLTNSDSYTLTEIENIAKILKQNKLKYFNNFSLSYDFEEPNLYKHFEKYLDNSNELDYQKYPTFDVYSFNKTKKEQVYLSFIRTENGYKLYDFRTQNGY